MTQKRFKYNVNKNTIEQDGKFVAYMNNVDGIRITNKLNVFQKENDKLKSENEDMRRLIDNVSLQRDEFHRGARENANRVGKLKKENKELKLLIQNWEALDEEKDEQLNKQNQTLKKLVKENEKLKQIINDKEVEWLRDNTVWEQMPTSKRTVTKTTFGDKND